MRGTLPAQHDTGRMGAWAITGWRVALGYVLFFAAAVGLSGVVGSSIGHWIFAGMGADNEHQVNRNTLPKSRRPRGCYKRVARKIKGQG